MTDKSTSLITVSVALAAVFTLGSGEAMAAAECTDAPAAGNWIECTEDSTSTDDITINADGVDIDTTGADEIAIYGKHEGNGNTTITIDNNSITASGEGSSGVRVESAAEVDEDGYRKQTVTVNGREIGDCNTRDGHYAQALSRHEPRRSPGGAGYRQ